LHQFDAAKKISTLHQIWRFSTAGHFALTATAPALLVRGQHFRHQKSPPMNLLDRLLGHDSWTTRQLLLLCQHMSDVELDRDFDIAHRTVRATFEHIIRNMEVWCDLMDGHRVERTNTLRYSISDFIARLNSAAATFTRIARSIDMRGGWDERWLDTLDNPPTEKSYGAAIAHILTHSMHHRAQLLYMLRMLGVQHLPEGDVFTWENNSVTLGDAAF
jgi:uncharacterized damage-inducible protein DinB